MLDMFHTFVDEGQQLQMQSDLAAQKLPVQQLQHNQLLHYKQYHNQQLHAGKYCKLCLLSLLQVSNYLKGVKASRTGFYNKTYADIHLSLIKKIFQYKMDHFKPVV